MNEQKTSSFYHNIFSAAFFTLFLCVCPSISVSTSLGPTSPPCISRYDVVGGKWRIRVDENSGRVVAIKRLPAAGCERETYSTRAIYIFHTLIHACCSLGVSHIHYVCRNKNNDVTICKSKSHVIYIHTRVYGNSIVQENSVRICIFHTLEPAYRRTASSKSRFFFFFFSETRFFPLYSYWF